MTRGSGRAAEDGRGMSASKGNVPSLTAGRGRFAPGPD